MCLFVSFPSSRMVKPNPWPRISRFLVQWKATAFQESPCLSNLSTRLPSETLARARASSSLGLHTRASRFLAHLTVYPFTWSSAGGILRERWDSSHSHDVLSGKNRTSRWISDETSWDQLKIHAFKNFSNTTTTPLIISYNEYFF